MKKLLLIAALILSASVAHAGTLAGSILSAGHVTGGGGGGTVDSVNGTTDRITSSGGTDPVIDIAATYVGQTSLTTLGTITTGIWNAGAVTSSGAFTGTGVVLGTGSITMTGSLAATGARVTKGWFTDIESTNCPTIGGTGCSGTGGIARLTAPTFATSINLTASNIITDTTTGTKFGTGTTQKIGFYNATPIVQPTGNVCTAMQNLGLVASCTEATGAITIGTTTIASGTDTRILYDNAGVVGEYTLTGTGTVAVMQTSPTLITPVLGVATGTSIALGGATIGTDALGITGTATISGLATAGGFSPTSSTATGNRTYLPAANTLGWAINGSGEVQLTDTALSPVTNVGSSLGVASTNMWQNLFLGSGSVINLNNGDLTLTQSSNLLTLAGGDISLGSNYIGTGGFGSSAFSQNLNSGGGTSGTAAITAINTAAYQVGASSNVSMRVGILGSNNTTLGVSNSYGSLIIAGSTVTEAGSGTHPLFASLAIKPVIITAGVATATNAATVYIEDAITATLTGASYALWVDAGNVRIDGQILATAMAQDTASTDESVCRDTTTGQLYRGTGTVGICLGSSSVRYKNRVTPMKDGLAQITALEPVNFYYNKDRGDNGLKQQYGFLAEDTVKVLPKLVGLDKEGKPNSVDILGMVPILVKAVKELKADNDNLHQEMDQLKKGGKNGL